MGRGLRPRSAKSLGEVGACSLGSHGSGALPIAVGCLFETQARATLLPSAPRKDMQRPHSTRALRGAGQFNRFIAPLQFPRFSVGRRVTFLRGPARREIGQRRSCSARLAKPASYGKRKLPLPCAWAPGSTSSNNPKRFLFDGPQSCGGRLALMGTPGCLFSDEGLPGRRVIRQWGLVVLGEDHKYFRFFTGHRRRRRIHLRATWTLKSPGTRNGHHPLCKWTFRSRGHQQFQK